MFSLCKAAKICIFDPLTILKQLWTCWRLAERWFHCINVVLVSSWSKQHVKKRGKACYYLSREWRQCRVHRPLNKRACFAHVFFVLYNEQQFFHLWTFGTPKYALTLHEKALNMLFRLRAPPPITLPRYRHWHHLRQMTSLSCFVHCTQSTVTRFTQIWLPLYPTYTLSEKSLFLESQSTCMFLPFS